MGAKAARRSMGAKAAERKALSSNPNLTLTPTRTLSIVLALSKIQYCDQAGGGRNMVYDTSMTNQVHSGKWMRAAQKGPNELYSSVCATQLD